MNSMPTDLNAYRDAMERLKPKSEGNGGDGMDRIERRVERLEGDVSKIKDDLAVIRSNYASTSDINTLQITVTDKINEVQTSLSNKINSMDSSFTGKMNAIETSFAERLGQVQTSVAVIESNYASKSDLLEVRDAIINKFEADSKWKWSGVFIPIATMIIGSGIAILITLIK
ncbi:TPA: hypothetical protein PXM78_004174 [Yersinia enterocolitica]|uniref:Uncharacterized protein n=1 Tax=Yersinia enterocolitica TaxID=630 RepID=A0A9P1PWK0_YEREN|nr:MULTISPECIES: hypothetical protein [Yersinia]EKN6387072.1 hypothetical protein [Yersinia enterocolitica]MDA5526866.1 hypothetical protein [Yersinia mollaretii]MDR7872261.1 hypothetical protein [Yersinia mollaretii]PHZ31718.1 hypothetical protein CS537_09610 [Yersinia mollaretii]WQC73222.1 hypothetical protein U1Z61_12125 [Yersinia mollaretii]